MTAVDARPEHDAEPLRFPAGLPLGHGHRRLPDRGRRRRGRPHAVHLGHLQPHPGQGASTATPATSPPTTTTAMRDDVALMARPRPRRLPLLRRPGRGCSRPAAAPPSRRGLDFYRRLVDELLDAGHQAGRSPSTTGTCRRSWRTPGGWPERDTAHRFAEYAEIVAEALGDRVERRGPPSTSRGAAPSSATAPVCTPRAAPTRSPRCAPRTTSTWRTAWPSRPCAPPCPPAPGVAISLNLARGPAAHRRRRPTGTRPAGSTPSPTGSSSARCCTARYPEDLLPDTAPLTDWSFVQDGDLEPSSTSRWTSLGVNYYTPTVVAAATADAAPTAPTATGQRALALAGRRRVAFHQPPGDRAPRWAGPSTRRPARAAHAATAARLPDCRCMITENGAAYDDKPDPDGEVHDPERIAYLHAPPHGRAPGDRGRRRRARLLPVVADGQLRVGVRLRQALRHRPRRLRHPAPDVQGQRALVRGCHRPGRTDRLTDQAAHTARPSGKAGTTAGTDPGGRALHRSPAGQGAPEGRLGRDRRFVLGDHLGGRRGHGPQQAAGGPQGAGSTSTSR